VARLPITVLTGFLGSGKTTVLSSVLAAPEVPRTAVIVNEIGAVGLDHLIVSEVTETVTLLAAGCLCCQLRSDLVDAVRSLMDQAARGTVPVFDRIVIETTGLAEPGPILQSLLEDVVISERCRLDGIVVAVDALNGAAQLGCRAEARRQVAVSDRLLLTKLDLADPATIAATTAAVRAINPGAPLVELARGAARPDDLFHAGLFDARTGRAHASRWLRFAAPAERGHDSEIKTLCLRFNRPWAWDSLVRWLDLLMALEGEKLLRLKGIVNVAGETRPVVIHGVHHRLHPPALLETWPDEDRGTRLVFITDGLDADAIGKMALAFRGGGAQIAASSHEAALD
jgi:G3E family GTPase